jgi:hypothetical protein
VWSRSRSRSDAAPSQAWAKRWVSASSCRAPVAATRSMPPAAPTAASWWWSPVSSSFAPACWQWAWMRTRSGVLAMADSSTTTRSPVRRRQRLSSPWAAPVTSRSWVASQRAMLRAFRPSPARTSVAIWDAARPITRQGRPARRAGSCQALARTPSTKLLPVPAGPTRVSTRAPELRIPRTAELR